MPFKSEAQRRYLWANEPEIARDWTDTYGSRIQKNDGGITDVAMQGGGPNYLGEQPMVNAPKYWQSSPDHEPAELAYITDKEKDILIDLDIYGSLQGSPNRGPSGIVSLQGDLGGYDVNEWDGYESGPPDNSSHGAGNPDQYDMTPPSHGAGNSNQYDMTPPPPSQSYHERQSPKQGLGIKNLFRTGLSIFGGWPGKIASFASGMGNDIFQGRGDYKNQVAWERAKQNRINQKRIDRILNRSDEFPITENTYKNLMDAGWEGTLPALDSTATSRGDINTMEGITGVDTVKDFDTTEWIKKISDKNAMDEYWKKELGNNQYQHANWFTDLFKKDPEDIQIGEEGSPLDEAKDILQKNKEEAEKTKERFKDI